MWLTAGTALAGRIDRTEYALMRAAAERARDTGQADVRILPVGGVAAILIEPGSPFNKLIGLGLGDPVEEEALEAAERAHAERGVPLQVELATLADPSVGSSLTARGYLLTGFENVLGRPLSGGPVTDTGSGITVDLVPAVGVRGWIDTVATAFVHEDSYDGPPAHQSFAGSVLERAYQLCAGVPEFRCYMAYRNSEPAGGASLYVAGGIAMCAGAATLPVHRRKGVQAALLTSRLRAAQEMGCDFAVVTTMPGSKSQANVQRAGFQLLYTRAILVRKDWA
jgi:GNAT superfamily N-acetyltransferase